MQTCKSMLVGRKSAHLAGIKYHAPSTPPLRPVVVKAMASSADGKGSQAHQLFQQHKVLLGAGFSYDQAALILQVSQQRKAGSPQLASAGATPMTGLAVVMASNTNMCMPEFQEPCEDVTKHVYSI
jgi:hypothetical protein